MAHPLPSVAGRPGAVGASMSKSNNGPMPGEVSFINRGYIATVDEFRDLVASPPSDPAELIEVVRDGVQVALMWMVGKAEHRTEREDYEMQTAACAFILKYMDPSIIAIPGWEPETFKRFRLDIVTASKWSVDAESFSRLHSALQRWIDELVAARSMARWLGGVGGPARNEELDTKGSTANPAVEPTAILLAGVYTRGLAQEHFKKCADICDDPERTVEEKLKLIDRLMPIPLDASAATLGKALKVTATAIQLTDWWRENRKGRGNERVAARHEYHRQRSDRIDRPERGNED